MTAPAPEKAAPIPADVLALARLASIEIGEWVVDRSRKHPRDIVADLLLADREARPSLPDSGEEQIRAEAAEDERDRLYASLKGDGWGVSGARLWLQSQDAMLPADRARSRQGGNNG